MAFAGVEPPDQSDFTAESSSASDTETQSSIVNKCKSDGGGNWPLGLQVQMKKGQAGVVKAGLCVVQAELVEGKLLCGLVDWPMALSEGVPWICWSVCDYQVEQGR